MEEEKSELEKKVEETGIDLVSGKLEGAEIKAKLYPNEYEEKRVQNDIDKALKSIESAFFGGEEDSKKQRDSNQ